MLHLCSVVHISEPPLNVRRISTCVLDPHPWVRTDWISPLGLDFSSQHIVLGFSRPHSNLKLLHLIVMQYCSRECTTLILVPVLLGSTSLVSILYYRMCSVSHAVYPQKWKRWKFAFKNSCGVTEKYSSEGSKIVTLSNILMLVILRLWAHVSGRGSIALSSKCVALPCDAAVWKDQDGRLYISQRKHASFLPPPVVEVVWSGRSGEWKWESAAEQICNAYCQIGKNWKSTRRNNLSLSPTSVSSSSPELNVSCAI